MLYRALLQILQRNFVATLSPLNVQLLYMSMQLFRVVFLRSPNPPSWLISQHEPQHEQPQPDLTLGHLDSEPRPSTSFSCSGCANKNDLDCTGCNNKNEPIFHIVPPTTQKIYQSKVSSTKKNLFSDHSPYSHGFVKGI